MKLRVLLITPDINVNKLCRSLPVHWLHRNVLHNFFQNRDATSLFLILEVICLRILIVFLSLQPIACQNHLTLEASFVRMRHTHQVPMNASAQIPRNYKSINSTCPSISIASMNVAWHSKVFTTTHSPKRSP